PIDFAFKKQKPISEMNEEEKKKLKACAKAIDKLYALNNEYDYTEFFGNKDKEGLFQKWIDMIIYNFAQSYGQDPDVLGYLTEDDEPEAFKELKNKNGDLEVPSLLHMDRAAYNNLLKMKDAFEKGTLRAELAKEHLSEAQIEATYKRTLQTIEHIKLMEKKAQPFLKVHSSEDPGSSEKFFLNADDYHNIKYLTSYAVNPGNSYLAIDNEQFLEYSPEYEQFMTDQEKKDALNARNKTLTDPKRWNDTADESLKCYISDDIDLRKDLEVDLEGVNTITNAERNKLEDQDKRWKKKKEEDAVISAEEKRIKDEQERIRREEEERKRKEEEERKQIEQDKEYRKDEMTNVNNDLWDYKGKKGYKKAMKFINYLNEPIEMNEKLDELLTVLEGDVDEEICNKAIEKYGLSNDTILDKMKKDKRNDKLNELGFTYYNDGLEDIKKNCKNPANVYKAYLAYLVTLQYVVTIDQQYIAHAEVGNKLDYEIDSYDIKKIVRNHMYFQNGKGYGEWNSFKGYSEWKRLEKDMPVKRDKCRDLFNGLMN
ncbi:MAG: hypothetical protein J6N76_03920, partial [Lachnospiraceae bacterium]|nr:hypothetical protein [Lachnospiraceae bacterium]